MFKSPVQNLSRLSENGQPFRYCDSIILKIVFVQALSKALQIYLERLPHHKVLLIVTEKLDANAQKSAWFKAVEQAGAAIQIWPIERQQLPNWLAQRAYQHGLKFEPEALSTLADLVEGNLLAATQALDRLALLVGDALISTQKLLHALSDQARFTIFDFVEALLLGDLKRAYRIFYSLKDEAFEPLFMLNMLTKEIRLLAHLTYEIERGQSFEQVIKTIYLPPKRQVFLSRILPRFSHDFCCSLMQKAMIIDQIIKGVQRGDCWQALSEFCLDFRK